MEDESQLDSPFPDKGVVVEGHIQDKIIISVPVDMSHNAVRQLLEQAPEDWRDKLIITTNNIKFMRAKYVEKGAVKLGRLNG